MKRHPITVVPLLFFLILTVPKAVLAAEWQFDKAHSGIYFNIQHIFSTVHGQFDDYSGTFVFDPENPAQNRIEIMVQTKSMDTRIAKRDDHLRSADFFAVAEYPTMAFKSSAIEHLEGRNYRVTGDLSIKDVTKTIEVPFVFHGVKDNPLQKGKQVAGFDARFTIDRLEYNVGDGKFAEMGVLGRDVDIFISLEMLRDK